MKNSTKLLKKVHIWQRLIAYSIFNDFCYDGDLDTVCRKIALYTPIIEKLRDWYNDVEKDYRTGYETYGYGTIESIEGNLEYISDRFCAAFRLNWMLNIPKEVQRLRSMP